jgi:hypothetical protein
LWITRGLCRNGAANSVRMPDTRYRRAISRSARAKRRQNSKLRITPEKGRPPPGGEEARVVVYQPRGVGLIHPRHGAEY